MSNPWTREELDALAKLPGGGDYRNQSACHAQRDGDCDWDHCPQEWNNRARYQSHCPLDKPPYCVSEEDRI